MYFYDIIFYYITMVSNEEIRAQLESLRREIRELKRPSFVIKQEDLWEVMGEQIRSILHEKVEKYLEGLSPREGTRRSAPFGKMLDDLIDENISIFEKEGPEKALEQLEELEGGFLLRLGASSSDLIFSRSVFDQMRSYYHISRAFSHYIPGPERVWQASDNISCKRPEEVEKALAPLANALRVNIMSTLLKEEGGLTDLARRMGKKKGHLQFHIRSLVAAGYIEMDSKSRLYHVTPRGKEIFSRVMEAITRA